VVGLTMCGAGSTEIIEMVERVYFDVLPFDLSAFSLARFEMEEVAMTQSGDVEVSGQSTAVSMAQLAH
jgi:hypothetical protein